MINDVSIVILQDRGSNNSSQSYCFGFCHQIAKRTRINGRVVIKQPYECTTVVNRSINPKIAATCEADIFIRPDTSYIRELFIEQTFEEDIGSIIDNVYLKILIYTVRKVRRPVGLPAFFGSAGASPSPGSAGVSPSPAQQAACPPIESRTGFSRHSLGSKPVAGGLGPGSWRPGRPGIGDFCVCGPKNSFRGLTMARPFGRYNIWL